MAAVKHAAHYWLLHPLLGSCTYELATNAAATSEMPHLNLYYRGAISPHHTAVPLAGLLYHVPPVISHRNCRTYGLRECVVDARIGLARCSWHVNA